MSPTSCHTVVGRAAGRVTRPKASPGGSTSGRDTSESVGWAADPLVSDPDDVLRHRSRQMWRGTEKTPALFFNQLGGRLGVRGAHDVSTGIAARSCLYDDTTAQVLRQSFATTLARRGTDLVIGPSCWATPG